MIGFYTQCAPYDHGLNLTKHANRFTKKYETYVDYIHLYNTESATLVFPDFKDYIQSFPEYCSYRGWTHHFWKWKPFLIHEYFKKIDYDDILVYHDCNLVKYKEYELGADKFRENVNLLLENVDILGAVDPKVTNSECAKKEIFLELGDFQDKPLIKTNRIFIRKTRTTEKFIAEWLEKCNTPLLFPKTDYPDYDIIHTCDQAIFNGLYYKYFDTPNVYLKDNTFTKNKIFFLNRSKPKPKQLSNI